jgi:multidrug resistance protein MdtO
VVAFASAWIAAGSPRISYMGLQLAFAFFLCVIQGPSPAFDLTVARDRVIGILFGNLTVFVLFTTLWPVSVTRRIDRQIASLLRRLASIAGAPGKWQRYPLATETQSELSEARQDCDLAVYEPAAIRRSQDWLDRRRRIIAEAAALEAPLFVSAAEDEGKASSTAARLMQLATIIEHPRRRRTASPDTQATSTAPTDGIATLVDLHIENLARLIDHHRQTGGVDHAPA